MREKFIGWNGTNYVEESLRVVWALKILHLFNLALLVKQRWRLLQAPQSLYCHMGPNPSYIWRSILAGWKVLVNWVVWKPSVTGTTRAIWNATPSGMYSVQSGYTCFEADLQTLVEGESSCSQSRRQVWRKFWKLQLPGKVKHFSGEPIMTLCPHISIFTEGRLETRRCVLSTFRMLKQSHTSYGNVF